MNLTIFYNIHNDLKNDRVMKNVHYTFNELYNSSQGLVINGSIVTLTFHWIRALHEVLKDQVSPE